MRATAAGLHSVVCEDVCYFVGSLSGCMGFIVGYNERQLQDGDETVFNILPVESIKTEAI